MPLAWISLTLSRHLSLSFIASGRSSGLHPVSLHSCSMYVLAGRPARPYVGVHRSTSLMSSPLLLQQCPACLVRLTWIVFVMGGRWLYSWCFVGCWYLCVCVCVCVCEQDLTLNNHWGLIELKTKFSKQIKLKFYLFICIVNIYRLFVLWNIKNSLNLLFIRRLKMMKKVYCNEFIFFKVFYNEWSLSGVGHRLFLIFQWNTAGLTSEFSFSKARRHTKAKELGLPRY